MNPTRSIMTHDTCQSSSNESHNFKGRMPDATRKKSNKLLVYNTPLVVLFGILLASVINFLYFAERDTDGINSTIDEFVEEQNTVNFFRPAEKTIINNHKDDDSRVQITRTKAPVVTNDVPLNACKYYLARSKIPNSGLGIFTTEGIRKGGQVGPGDVVIQAPDLNPYLASALNVLLFDYAWDSSETGGQFEGKRVFSFIPGIGMAANGHQHLHNTVNNAQGSKVDNAALTRDFPGAGANSHYHDFNFLATRDIEAGSEILLNYGSNWFKEREIQRRILSPENMTLPKHAPLWLHDNGICLDNIRVQRSTKRQAGRGAFATRSIPKGSVVAPAPVVQILDRKSLEIIRVKQDSDTGGADVKEEVKLLLLNYCFGHINSSLLFFPYAPLVNFINHDYKEPNVDLRWSTSSHHDFKNELNITLENIREMRHAGLMLEFVAKREIGAGEEIFLNYGELFENAWNAHVNSWSSLPKDPSFGSAQIQDLNKVITIRTQDEQHRDPYPNSVFTSCYYIYFDGLRQLKKSQDGLFIWNESKSALSAKSLRPCVILNRHEIGRDGRTTKDQFSYTVKILNRFGLALNERVPQGERHIVTGMPRDSIRFSNKIHTTDQHMTHSFRHEIHLQNDIFPLHWQDSGSS